MKRGLCAMVGVWAVFAATTASAIAAPPSSSGGWVVGGTAAWKTHAGDNTGRGPNYGLVTTSSGAGTYTSGTYGEADLNPPALPTADPSQITALSYDFNAAQSGPSGGSPRLVVCFSDSVDDSCNDNAELGPNTWTAGVWTHVDGSSQDANSIWVNNGSGGSCGYEYNTTWSTIVGCHSGQTIIQVRIVNDSGWEYPAASSEQITLDNLTVNNAVATGP